jgi:hypothetical protein
MPRHSPTWRMKTRRVGNNKTSLRTNPLRRLEMFAVIAAVLFALALLLNLIGESIGIVTATTLMLAGLLFVALHLMPGFGRRRR